MIPRRHELGLLLSVPTRWRLVLAMAGAAVVASTEIVALAAVLPLMQLLTGEMPVLGPLGPADEALGLDERGVAVALASLIFGAFFIKGLVGIAYRWWVGGFIARQQVDTAARLLTYYLKADYALHLRRTIGDFIRRLNDAVQQTYSGVVMSGVSVVMESLTVIAILAALVWSEPLTALLMIGYFGVSATLLFRFTRGPAERAGRRQLQAAEQVFRFGIEPLENIKDVKLRDNSQEFVRPYQRVRWQGAMAGRVAGFLNELPKFVFELVFIGGVAALTIYLFSTSSSSSAIAVLALFALAGFRLLPALTRLLASLTGVKVNSAGMHMVLDEMVGVSRTLAQVRRSVPPRAPFKELLSLEGVSFRYEGSTEDVLTGIDLALAPGMSLGIVGGSGAGKTTLVDLIMGFHEPTEGRILVDGKDYSRDRRPWQQNIGMVPQDVVALVGTVTENISFRDPQPEQTRVQEAAVRAQLNHFVNRLPEGYETILGPGGMGLSGGQRQRLGLARALYRDPAVLILDEATSALDNETEHRVTEAIQLLSDELTVIVIAHRLSTVRHCDQILFLDAGRIAALGTFDEVYSRNAAFARLVDLGSLDRPQP